MYVIPLTKGKKKTTEKKCFLRHETEVREELSLKLS